MLDIQRLQSLFDTLLGWVDNPDKIPVFDPDWLSANEAVLESFNNKLPDELEQWFLFTMVAANAGLIEIKEIK